MPESKTKYKKVMVVDDTYVDRFIAEHNIRKYDFAEEVISKDTAQKALDYLMEMSDSPGALPQIIFLDINLPGLDGFGFLDEFGKLPDEVKKNCVIILLSTIIHPDHREQAKNNIYVSRLLGKPLDKEILDELTAAKII